mmetsp:Transcript_14696/g.16310  ORF Transcript_14696/g.16310 Transcript_14696/m.16310 type:complete len:126 (-) Transcript_14696:1051-1428(-)
MSGADGFIVVYDVTTRSSFDEVKNIHETITKAKAKAKGKVPLVVVGNKIDLAKDGRKVTEKEGASLGNRLEAVFIEASATEKINVDTVFYSILLQIKQQKEIRRTRTTRKLPVAPIKQQGCCVIL